MRKRDEEKMEKERGEDAQAKQCWLNLTRLLPATSGGWQV